jgi:hypothetical protein
MSKRFEMVWDAEAKEMVYRSEYEQRKGSRRQFKNLPQKVRWVKRGLWKWDATRQKLVAVKETKPRLTVPAIQTDDIPPTESMATGDREVFTSKAKLMRHYKEHGFHVREQGEEVGKLKPPPRPKTDPRELRETIARTINDLRWGNIPLSEKEKELCRREERETQRLKRKQ